MKGMKKIYFFLVFMFCTSLLYSQPWLKNLPQNKSRSELTFFDYRNAFETYWAPFHVEDGYYMENGVKKKAYGWKQFKRWEYDMERQVNPVTGQFPQRTAQEIYEEYLKANPQYKSVNLANWSSLGPSTSTGGYAGIGRINCVAFHPSDNNTYWIGGAAGGLWVTTNNGSTWTCLTDNNGVLAVSDIIIPADYATSHTIYIATGDRDHWDNRSIGVLKSTDSGVTWNTTGLTYALSSGAMVYRLLQDPGNSQVLIAATSGGVYKTTNGGTTWNTQLTSTSFIDMEYKPGDFTTIYGSTTGGRIYVSTTGGTSWTQAFYDAAAYRIELAVSANQPSWVYAVAANSASGLYGIYQSTNSGTSFTQVFAGTTLNLLGWNSNGGDSGGQGWYDLCIASPPSNANTLLVGGVNTWRSTNGGTSWSIVNHWWGDGVPAVHADKHNLAFRPNGDLFETNDGGVYFSPNNGTSWTDKTNGIVVSQMYKLGVSATVANEVITGLQDNGTKLLTGGSWADVKGGDGMECLIDYTDVNIQYGTYVNGQISRTTNHWSSSTNIQPGSAGSGAWVTPYIIDPNNAQTLYAGYADVWKTTNRGTAWTKISTMNTSSKIRSMAIAPSNTQYLYVSDPTHIWKTTNGGTSWTDITGTLPVGSGNLTYVTVKNDDPNTLWVTLSGYNANTVFQSADAGTTWTNMAAGLPQIPAYAIVQNRQSASEVQLYVGTELGVYFKKGTANWVPFNTGLANVKIGEIEIYYAASAQNSKLRAATFGRGLWETLVYYECTPLPVPTITGPATVCAGTTGVTYSTETGMTGYSWTVSSGGTITGGSGTSQITVTWTASGNQTVSVNYFNSNGCTAPSPTVKNVTVTPAPLADFTFPGTDCEGQSVQFTDASLQNGGGSIIAWHWNFDDPSSGSGNTSTVQNPVHVFASAGTYYVEQIVTNISGCTDTIVKAVAVNLVPVPAITGPAVACATSAGNVYATQTGMTNYLWTLSAGGTITAGGGTTNNTVTVTWNAAGAQSVSVNYTNPLGCAASSPVQYPVTVNPLPGPSGPVSGQSEVCAGETGVMYSVAAIPNAGTYLWTLPSGATIVSGNTTNVIAVDFSVTAVSGNITVYGENSCGDGASSPVFPVTVYPIPAQPVITYNGTDLASNYPSGNQWYLNNANIPGATGQTWHPVATGIYWATETAFGCTSDTSNHIYVVMVGMNGNSGSPDIILSPNPNQGRFSLAVRLPQKENYSVDVYNSIGVLVYERKELRSDNQVREVIDLHAAPEGFYTVVVKSDTQSFIRKMLICK
jgi:photosystem II stability/assembly factor-like uncharacterized protein